MTNMDVGYVVTHTRKHKLSNVFTQVDSAPIVDDILSGLWALRKNPHFYSYENGEQSNLAKLIDFDVECSELDKPHGFGFDQDDRDSYRKLAESTLIVPDVTDTFTRGLLTDVVKATKERVLCDGKLFDGEDKSEYLKRRCLDIDVAELRKIFADKHAYATFIIGYCFPRLGDAEEIVDKTMRLSGRLNNPIAHIECLLGRSL